MTQALDQRMANLTKANEVRFARAELKVELAAGARTLAEVLRADEDFIQTMKLADLLRAVPAFGKTKAQRALAACWISPSATVRALPPQRREQLLAWIAANYQRVRIEREIEAELWGGKGGYR